MSRKREKQREDKKELARQLDVDKGEVPHELIANARVSEPEVSASLVLREVKRGLLSRPKRIALDVALYIVDAAGVRMARRVAFEGAPTKSGAVALELMAPTTTDKVRYTRPGSFVALAVVIEGAFDAPRGSFADTTWVPNPDELVAEAVRNHLEAPRAIAMTSRFDDLLAAAGMVVIPAVDRVQTSVDVPLKSAHVDAVATLKLRL